MMSIKFLSLRLIVASSILIPACRESSHSVAPPSQPIPVSVITADYQALPAFAEVPGSVAARHKIVLSSQLNGFARDVHVRAGAMVREGQVLVTLDSREAESQRDAARATIEEASAALEEARKAAAAAESMRSAAEASAKLAESTLARYRKLFESKSVSPQELDEVRTRRDLAAADLEAKVTMVDAAGDRIRQIEARISQANAQARRADVVLSYAVLKAPTSAKVAERLVDPGSAVFPGSPLLVLDSGRNLQVTAEIPTTQSDHLRLGLEVQIADDRTDSKVVTGRVSEIIPISDPGTHTVRFKVDLPGDYSSPPGHFVKVLVPAGEEPALLIPREALRITGQLTGVFVVDRDSAARFRLVKTTEYDGDRVEILAGVEPGEKIVANPGPQISDGIPLEVR
jgi:multidrug efflux pump subunit AcrA (membrane-fusion protein)